MHGSARLTLVPLALQAGVRASFRLRFLILVLLLVISPGGPVI
jgi:hypothetical protein